MSSSHRFAFCFSLLLLLLASDVSANEVKELILNGFWRKVFEEENNSPLPVSYTKKTTTGLRTHMSDENTVMVAHTAGINIQGSASKGDLKKGDTMKVLSIGISYQFQHTTTSIMLRGSEIHRTREQSVTFTVPGWTRLVRWQLVVNIAGVEYDYDHMLTATNSTEVPMTINATATVELRKQIHFGLTPIRIKYKADGRYMIVVKRKNWPAGTLGRSNLFHYVLYDSGSRGIRVQTLNSMYPGYQYLYSSTHGGLYFDKCRDSGNYYNGKQYWYLSKSAPLYDGDVVTFRNNKYDTSYICYTGGSKSVNLYCLKNREEEWILEVV